MVPKILNKLNGWTTRVKFQMAKPKPLTEEEECLLATMPRGSVLLYPSATVHGASANQTEEMRDVCLFAYSPVSWC